MRWCRIILAVVLIGAVLPALAAETPEAPAGDPKVSEDTLVRGDAYYHLMKAMLVAKEAQVREAIRHLRTAIELEPDSADLRAEAANLLYLLGQRFEAESTARQALELDPENARALELLAEMLVNRAMAAGGDAKGLREGVALYERLAALPDADVEVWQMLANLHLELGDTDAAVAAAERLVELRPGDAGALRMLVRSQVQAARPADAIRSMAEYLIGNPRLDPEGPEAQHTLGWMSKLVRDEQAWPIIAEHGQALREAQPDLAMLHGLVGEALLRTGDNEGAAASLERSIELSIGDDAESRFFLATAYGSMGRLADAVELTRNLTEEFPDHGGVRNLLGELLAQQGDNAAAIAALGRALETFQNEPQEIERREGLRRRIVSLYLLQDDTDSAGAILDSFERPDGVAALEARSVYALETGDFEAARDSARRLREAEPTEIGQALALEAEALAREGKESRARSRYADAAARLSNVVWARAAMVFDEIGRPEVGEELLRAWVAQEPENPQARFRLGSYLERAGDYDDARAELERAIELDPLDAEALNYLGYSLADRDRDLQEALGLIERAVAINPWNGAFLDSLGWVYYRMGRYVDAREPLERAAREYPRDAVVLDHLGDVYARLGESEDALRLWLAALELEGDNAETIREKISKHADAAQVDRDEPDAVD